MRAVVAARTDVGRVRQGNEDAYLVREPLFVVADGMGGHLAGEIASETAIETITEAGPEVDPGSLADLVKKANAAIWDKAQGDDSLHGMGTTCTLMLIEPRRAHLAHVGDSRAYLFRDGTLKQLTEDHTLVERMVREGRLSPEEAEHHPQRSIITRALGVDAEVEVDTSTVDLQEGDRLLLCSDGLTGMVDHGEMTRVLAEEQGTDQAVDALVDAANRAGGEDNITVVLIDLRGDGAPAPPAPVTDERSDTEPDVAPERAPKQAEPVPVATSPDPRRRWPRRLALSLLVIVVLGAAAWGARAFTLSNSYFVGVSAGVVTIYKGIPEDFAGVAVREPWETTDIRLSDLPEFLQEDVTEGIRADSLADAQTTVHNLQQRANDAEFDRREKKS